MTGQKQHYYNHLNAGVRAYIFLNMLATEDYELFKKCYTTLVNHTQVKGSLYMQMIFEDKTYWKQPKKNKKKC